MNIAIGHPACHQNKDYIYLNECIMYIEARKNVAMLQDGHDSVNIDELRKKNGHTSLEEKIRRET